MTWNVQPHHVAAGIVDVFGEYIETEYFHPAPVRTIAITPELRAADAAARQAREAKAIAPGAAWAIKGELRAENLVRRPAAKNRRKPRREMKRVKRTTAELVSVPKNAASFMADETEKYLAMANASSDKTMARGIVVPSLRLPDPVPVLEALALSGVLEIAEQVVNRRRPGLSDRVCVGNCGRRLRSDNKSGYCQKCIGTLGAQEKRRQNAAEPRFCAGGCGAQIRQSNKSGYCSPCSWRDPAKAAQQSAKAKRYRDRLTEQAAKFCVVCSTRLKWTNKSGVCGNHTSSLRNLKTVLRAGGRAEWESDIWWSKLSPAEKSQVSLVWSSLTSDDKAFVANLAESAK